MPSAGSICTINHYSDNLSLIHNSRWNISNQVSDLAAPLITKMTFLLQTITIMVKLELCCVLPYFLKNMQENNESILRVYCLCKLVLGLQHIMLTITKTLHRNSHCWGDNGRAGVRSAVCANTSTDDRRPQLLLCLYMTAEGACEASGLFRVCFKLITFIDDSGGTPRGHCGGLGVTPVNAGDGL